MRMVWALLVGAVCAPYIPAQETNAATRFGVASDFSSYPQATPKEALSSVLKAIDNKRIDYLLAQLSDPLFQPDAGAVGRLKFRLELIFDVGICERIGNIRRLFAVERRE